MTERPLDLTENEVCAILDGKKTQVRLPVDPQPWLVPASDEASPLAFMSIDGTNELTEKDCPFGAVGDRLWVREPFRLLREMLGGATASCAVSIQYRATMDREHFAYWKVIASSADSSLPDGTSKYSGEIGEHRGFLVTSPVAWKPGRCMPRWASRITLEILGVRLQHIQDTGIDDMFAEGVDKYETYDGGRVISVPQARGRFRAMWNDHYAESGLGWEANPTVWAITFKCI